ncbi:cytidylyltransferase domain-containing protein [Halosimplex halobium]|uniref:cytidylyltransferase domain-containing protein n=1 Tax=Halosimplex halobium TaxID=3396618 RepID=UPI003F5724CE
MVGRTGIVSIQARMGSTRLPGKVLLPIKENRVIERVMNQCDTNSVVEQVVLAIGDEPENDALTELCQRNNYEYVVGPEDDLLDRHRNVAKAFDPDFQVRVTGDCPFVPTDEIVRLVQAHHANDAVYTTNADDSIPDGIVVDVVEVDVLNELAALGDEHPTSRLRQNPENWNVSFDVPEKWTGLSEAHLAVDTPSDYWMLIDAIESVGGDPMKVAKWCLDHQNRSE